MAKKAKADAGAAKALADRIKAASKLSYTGSLSDSQVFVKRKAVRTSIPAINLALSGDIFGGLDSGLLTLAGPSKHFKSLFGLIMVKAFLDADPEAVCMFFDSEFGMPEAYFKSLDIDVERVVHIPITNVEEFKFEVMTQLELLTKKDKVIMFVDSIGNLASKKEVEDAIEGKGTTDMTRAKQFKSVFRMVTPHLTLKEIPMIVINHTYKEQASMYPRDIVGGGTGIYYSSDDIWIIGRRQNKDSDGLKGFEFVINIEKSRNVKEKSQIPVMVTFDGGVDVWSGLLEIALELGYVNKPSNGWYSRTHIKDDKKFRESDTGSVEFWGPVLKDTDFRVVVAGQYKVAENQLINKEQADLLEQFVTEEV